MVEPTVEIEKGFIRKARDLVRIAAALLAVDGLGIEAGEDGVGHLGIGAGEGAAHFVVDDAAVGQRILWFFDVEMPALLQEDLLAVVDRRMKNGVEVDVHEVVEILVVLAGHRIDGLIGEGHGVEEGGQARAQEIHERLLGAVFARAVEHAVLEDVGDTGAALRRCAEADAEDLVGIAVFQLQKAGAAFFVDEEATEAVCFRHWALFQEAEAGEDLVGFH